MSKMKALANKTLQQRVENYIRKVNEVGNYKYIDGYTKASDKVFPAAMPEEWPILIFKAGLKYSIWLSLKLE